MSGATAEHGKSWLEERRRRAWELKNKGWLQSEIAEALGVTEGAVSMWLKRAREGGEEALRARKRGGSQPQLSAEQRARLPDVLLRGAEAFGFEGDVWTLPRIAEVIRREFGVEHHPAHVSRILRACGWSCQKPAVRATERNEEAIATWTQQTWPEIKKKAQERGQTIAFVDESGFYRLPSVVRTWAPAGQTPVVRGPLRRLHLSVISAAIPDGRLYLTMKDKAYTAPDVVLFLKHLLAQIPGELVVIWDGSNIHRGPVVEQFLATAQGQRITTNQLPGYAPELNPDEWVWNHLKRVGLRNLSCPGLDDLRKALRRAVVRLQRRRHVVAAFVQHVYGV